MGGFEPIEWADIAKMNLTRTAILSQQIEEKVPNAKRLLDKKNFRQVNEAIPVAAFLKT